MRNYKLYETDMKYLLSTGALNILFGNESTVLNEINTVLYNSKKRSYINIYIRTRFEGRANEINHGPSIKVCYSDQNGSKPSQSNDNWCVFLIHNGEVIKNKISDDMVRKHGNIIRAFIETHREKLLEYWNCENNVDGLKRMVELQNYFKSISTI